MTANAEVQLNYYDNNVGMDYNNNNNYYKSEKDNSKKSVSLNKIKCINDNVNINGVNSGDVNIGNKGQLISEEGDLNTNAFGGNYGERYNGYYDGYTSNKKDKGFDCIINNDNQNRQVTLLPTEPTSPPTPPTPPTPPPTANNVCTVWQDDTDNPFNYDILFSGSRDDGETFSTPLNISRHSENSKEPQVKCDGNNVYVVWEESTATSDDNDIFFSFSQDGGQTFSTRNLSNDLANSEDAQISSQGNNVYVVWQNGTQNILFVRITDGGQTLSEPVNVSNSTRGVQDPQISSEGNNVYVVWREFLSFPNLFDTFIARSTDGGQTFSEPDNIGNNTGSSSNPQISSRGNNVYVVWENDITTSDTTDIFFSFSQNSGEAFSDPFNLSNSTGDSVNPQIASEDNNVYVVWQDRTLGNTGIFFARSTDGGLTFGGPNNISENTAFSANPQISSEGNNVYVVWLSDNGDILFARSIDGGLTFGELDNISEGNTGFSELPQISSEGNNVYVVWQGLTDDDFFNTDIFFSFSHDGGETFSTPPDNISNNTGVSLFPQLSSTGETQQQSTNNNIITTADNNNNEPISIQNVVEQKEGQKSIKEQGTQDSSDLTAMEKITKLKQQWMELTP